MAPCRVKFGPPHIAGPEGQLTHTNSPGGVCSAASLGGLTMLTYISDTPTTCDEIHISVWTDELFGNTDTPI